ncbi:HNH endonuclease [Hyphococcus sp. DH-69]|uniref:HNH endonuclease n=1 Tax=Hyphococcus formosus TaxID=3143534 RepID=UPI00398B2C5E
MPEIAELTHDHLNLLEWFENHQGQKLDKWPGPIGEKSNIYIANKAKGICRPKGFEYSTSLRISYGERYGDGPDVFYDGTWRLLYHIEIRANQSNPKRYGTNAGVIKCRDDGVPIGVLQQVSKNPSTYLVFGLGVVTGMVGDYFIVEGPVSLAGVEQIPQPRIGIDVEKILYDAREKSLLEVYRRQGQGRFREELLSAYNGTCAISGCRVVDVLEAAHILPHRGLASNRVQNGILLRADIHSLFDLGLIEINPDTYKCSVAANLKNDLLYQAYDGKKLCLPKKVELWPDQNCLRQLLKINAARR